METNIAPNRKEIKIADERVMTFGLTGSQNRMIENVLPTKKYALFDIDVSTDLIAISASALIINATVLDIESRNMIFDYYTEVGGCTDETVFWIGESKPPRHLREKFKCYDKFEEFAVNLKYHLLNAHKKSKKAKDFSRKLADCLMILALIQSKPGIKTRELVEKLEIPTRTIQRYISTLQAAGEWIAYDYTKKGWYLQDGISSLLGEFHWKGRLYSE